MKRRRSLLCLLLVGLGSCGTDGGSSGTGVTTAQGNVVNVQVAALPKRRAARVDRLLAELRDLVRIPSVAIARNEVEDIRVSVEGTRSAARTDSSGTFSLRGRFGGPVSLLFERADDGVTARVTVNIPTGGTLTLNNVRIDNRSGDASAESRILDFPGRVAATDCGRGNVDLVSEQTPDDGNHYTIRTSSSSFRDRGGNALGCEDLREGDRVKSRGVVNDDGTIREADVEDDSHGGRGEDGAGEGSGDTGKEAEGAKSGPDGGGGSSGEGSDDSGHR